MGRGRGSEVQCRGEGTFTALAVPWGSRWGAIPPSAKHQHTHPGAALRSSWNCSGVAAAQLSSRSLSPQRLVASPRVCPPPHPRCPLLIEAASWGPQGSPRVSGNVRLPFDSEKGN